VYKLILGAKRLTAWRWRSLGHGGLWAGQIALMNISQREKKLAVEDTLRIMNQNVKHLIYCF
jgi:hypothetical protein